MAASALPAAISTTARARARNADAVEGRRMRRGHARARARVNIGRFAEIFNRVGHPSMGHRYFVEKPIAGLGNVPRGLNGRGP